MVSLRSSSFDGAPSRPPDAPPLTRSPAALPRRAVAAAADQADALCPSSAAAELDLWLAVAQEIEGAAAAWIEPSCHAASPEDREAAQHRLEALLQQLDGALEGATFLVRVGSAVLKLGNGLWLFPPTPALLRGR
jgi:hypothetical protein